MPTDSHHFSLDRVKAYRAYFEQCRRAAKGKPEYNDLDTTVKLCDQLIAVMSGGEKPARSHTKKTAASGEAAPEKA